VIYADIKIDGEAIMNDLLGKYGEALPFAVEIGYVTDGTLDFVLAKAGINASAIEALVGESDSKENEKKEDDVTETPEGNKSETNTDTDKSEEASPASTPANAEAPQENLMSESKTK